MSTLFSSASFDGQFDELISNTLDLALEALQGFAADPEFLVKMASVFGEGNDYSLWQTAFATGSFVDFPTVEVLDGETLQGANGAYATENNTIYFSSDFLQAYSKSPEAIVSVWLEEVGHSVDAQINEVDSPGDEGTLFSALVQGIELSDLETQLINTENDSVLLNLNGNLLNTEKSDGYHFDFQSVLNQLIEDGGKSRLIFVNGGAIGDNDGILDAWSKLDSTLKFTESSWLPEENENYGSIWYDPAVNPNRGEFQTDFFEVLFSAIFDFTFKKLEEEISEVSSSLIEIENDIKDIKNDLSRLAQNSLKTLGDALLNIGDLNFEVIQAGWIGASELSQYIFSLGGNKIDFDYNTPQISDR